MLSRKWPLKPPTLPFRSKPDAPVAVVRIDDEKGGMASSIRDRLEVFYTTHNPTKLGEIDRLLSQFAGAEATLLQTMHRKYGVRDLESDVAVDEVYENERYSFLTMGFGSSFPGHLTVLDRKRYSGSHGTPSSQVFEQVEPTLPESADPAYQWAWTGPWEIDATYAPCDRDGWTYAFDFSNFSPMLLKDEGKASPGMTDYTRRRRWARTRILNRVAPAVEDVEMPIKVELQELPEIPLPAPDANLPLRFYSKNLSLESHKNAWSHQVNKLQKLHARLEHIMAGRHLMWKRTKVELKAQVKSTLATVNGLRAQIAADEKRGVKDLATQSSLDVQLAHYEDLKRRIWFPKEKGYLLRGNLIGLFVGIKDIWVDTIKVQFGASISPLPDGTVRCHVTFKGQVTIRLHGVKLKAEKGTRVPNSRWSSVFLTTQCVGDLVLLYNATDGHWTPEPSKGIEFYKMQLKVTGGLDLPDGLFKMLLTEVANTLVQEVLFAHFPPELGPLFQHESSAFEVRGELQVEGPAIANLVDATLEPVNEREESKMPVQAFDDVATLLGLTRSQLNLLVGLRGFLLCPQPHSFQSLRAVASYFRTYWLAPHAMDNVEPVLAEWTQTWQHLLELLLLQRQLDPRGCTYELFDFKACVLRTKRDVLDKHVPCRVQLSHLVCNVQLANVVQASSDFFARYMSAVKVTPKKPSPETSVYGIRIGRKSWTAASGDAPNITHTVTKEVEAQIAEVRALGATIQTLMNSCAVEALTCDVDGKMTGTDRAGVRDAKVKVRITDLQAHGRGPINFDQPLSLLYALGQLSVESSADLGAIDVGLQTAAGLTIAHAKLRDVYAQCDLDLTRLQREDLTVPLVITSWGPTNAKIDLHQALTGRVRVASTDVDTHLQALLEAFCAAVSSQFSLAGVWPAKVAACILKYCSSDEFLVAWSVRLRLDPRGALVLQPVDDHPQPFLYFDHLQVVPLLLDVEAMVQFWIETQLAAKL